MFIRDRNDRLSEFLEDSSGIYSMTRLVFFINNITSVVVLCFCTFALGEPDKALGAVGVIQGVGYVGKVSQKSVEERSVNRKRKRDED